MNNFCSVADQPEVELAQVRDCPGSDERTLAERFETNLAVCELMAECVNDTLWQDLPERERSARLLMGMGSKSKAQRYRDCDTTAIPVVCLGCQAKYYSRSAVLCDSARAAGPGISSG